MARPLIFDLDQIALGNSNQRQPVYQVLVYDLRSTTDTIRDIIVGNTLLTLTGPLDITNIVSEPLIKEQAGAYFSGGIAATELTFRVIDERGRFDPLGVAADPTIEGRFFRTGNVIRIIEGDAQVDASFYPVTFTGTIFGQCGYDRNKTTGKSELTVRATGRQTDFNQYSRTSDEFTIGTSLLTVATTIATDDMGLDVDEIDFPNFGADLIPHKSVQFVDETPMMVLSRIGFLDTLLPFFTGEGKLSMIPDRATGAAARLYDGRNHIISIIRPVADVKPPNAVCVVGLSATLSKAVMPRSVLATFQITTGFFDKPVKERIFFRDDKTLFAENVRLKTQTSVNGGLSGLGGGETLTPILSGDPEQLGTIGVELEVDNGFAPWLVILLLTVYIDASLIPDEVATFFTIPVGRIVQAVVLISAMIIMMKIGRGSYAFTGDPFEYVYAEVRNCAEVSGTGAFAGRNELVLENHLISTAPQAKAAAFEQLVRAQADKTPRTITMIHDLGMEPGDIMEFLDTGDRFLVAAISRTLVRDPSRAIATVTCFDITSTVHVGT